MTASPAGILKTIGELSVDEFMQRYWQRKPLLARAALPGFESPVSPELLWEMASRDDVQTALVNEKLALMATAYMQELRTQAIIVQE